MLNVLRKNWFMLGLVGVALGTVADSTGFTTSPGLWLKSHKGPDFVIVLIFLLSGLALNTDQIRSGIADIRGTLLALVLIFLIAPLVAVLFTFLPLETGVIIGLFLVAVMPTTLSSGVVMTGAAGGNMAHALVITIIANSLAVFTIPIGLGLLFSLTGESRSIEIEQLPIMIKIGSLVLLPLISGIVLRNRFGGQLRPFLPYTAICNQLGILLIVWMALCAGREAIVAGLDSIVAVILVVSGFHLVLVLIALTVTRFAGIPKKRRESIIFMGGQKTLPLSVILQVTLFSEFGIALVMCVTHHIIHLIMDAYLIRYLKEKE
jgi:sodium/bile acid cotransporter 7